MLSRLLPLLALASPPCLAQAEQKAPPPAEVGAPIPDYEFATLVGHDGRTRLSELVGQPVLIAGFTTHLVDGMHAARPAYELAEKHGKDGLLVVYQDRNVWRGASPGVGPMGFWLTVTGSIPWLTSQPAKSKKPDLPIRRSAPADERSLVLIGVDGRLVVEGRAEEITERKKRGDLRARVARLVAAEITKRKRGWGTDRGAKNARAAAFGKDRIAQALDALDKSTTPNAEQAAARAEIERHFAARLESIAFYLREGRYLDAAAAAKTLGKSVAGRAAFEERLVEASAELRTREGKRETALDKKLWKILAPVLGPKKKAKADLLGKLRLFVRKNAGSKVAAHAERLDSLVRDSIAQRLNLRVEKLEELAAAFLEKRGR